MENISHKGKKKWMLIMLILFSIVVCAMSGERVAPLRFNHLSNVLMETHIPEIPYIHLTDSKYHDRGYLHANYEFDGRKYYKDDVADEIIRKLKKSGYRIKVFDLSDKGFYIVAKKQRFLLDITGSINSFYVTVDDEDIMRIT